MICCPPPLSPTRQRRLLFAPNFLISFRAEALCFVGTGLTLVR